MKITKTKLLKIMHKHCLRCCCGSHKEVELCPDTDCVLFPFRFGTVKKEAVEKEKIVDLVEQGV